MYIIYTKTYLWERLYYNFFHVSSSSSIYARKKQNLTFLILCMRLFSEIMAIAASLLSILHYLIQSQSCLLSQKSQSLNSNQNYCLCHCRCYCCSRLIFVVEARCQQHPQHNDQSAVILKWNQNRMGSAVSQIVSEKREGDRERERKKQDYEKIKLLQRSSPFSLKDLQERKDGITSVMQSQGLQI